MSQDKSRRAAEDLEREDEVEILEVVGVDENGLPIDAPDPDDIEVVFDEAPSDEALSDEALSDEAPSDEAPPGDAPAEAAPVQAPTEEAELRERLMRLQADFENFKKRIDRERFDHFRFATVSLVSRILPVLDNFDRAIAAVQQQGATSDALIEGLALIQRQLAAELEAEGLRPMESVGELFDPERHEAVATDPEAPVPPHTVTQVFQRGYFLHDRVLRPAMVRVRVDESEGSAARRERKES